MKAKTEYSYAPDYAIRPGETLQEALDERGMTQAELARRADRPLKTINEIVRGKAAITADTAIQLERVLGVSASFWGRLEVEYRTAIARAEERHRLGSGLEALDRFPIREMMRHGLIPRTTDKPSTLASLLSFFGVSTLAALESYLATNQEARFRQSSAFTISTDAVAVWLRWGERKAADTKSGTYDEASFRKALANIRKLTPEHPRVFEAEMKRLCLDAGVVVVILPELPLTRASGATQWLATDRAVIQLSIRGRTNDRFWFTFFHEAAHLLLHSRRQIFVEDVKQTGTSSQELEASQWAAEFLISPEDHDRLLASAYKSATTITRFARELGIAPGIVVGRLQNDHHLPWPTPLNRLKRRFTLAAQ